MALAKFPAERNSPTPWYWGTLASVRFTCQEAWNLTEHIRHTELLNWSGILAIVTAIAPRSLPAIDSQVPLSHTGLHEHIAALCENNNYNLRPPRR